MARTLYMNDGSTELVLGDSETTLQKIIYERLGRDCEELFTEILEEQKEMSGDDYEKIADGYHTMLNDVLCELNGVLDEFSNPRLNRQKVQKALTHIRDNLHKNM